MGKENGYKFFGSQRKMESEIHENIMRKSEEATSIVRKDMYN